MTSSNTPSIDTPSSKKVTEKKYQHYAYSRSSTQMITPTGKKFSFVGGAFITDDVEIIDYLATCIASGVTTITKGALLTAKEADPMAAYKDKVIAEYEAEKAEAAVTAALGTQADMGTTNTGKSKPFSPMSTNELANAGMSSSAGAAKGGAKGAAK